VPVVIKGVEMMSYVMRMGEKMPIFNFWGRGREVIHRLIMKAATTDSLDDLEIRRAQSSPKKSTTLTRAIDGDGY